MDIQLIEKITDDLSGLLLKVYCAELSGMNDRITKASSDSLDKNHLIDIIGSGILSYLVNSLTEISNQFRESIERLQRKYKHIIHEYKVRIQNDPFITYE